jgi:A/G-specific adenine glycosylase
MTQQTHKIWPRRNTLEFRKRLLRWYGSHKRVLPWRSDPTPYNVWISEVMLQQTQVQTVLPYYERFMKRFPDVYELAGSGEGEFLSLWSGLGYYGRARNLLRSARRIVTDCGGKLPETFEDLQALPGIGRYTAGAILSIAYNKPEAIVDGNIRRVMCRLHGVEKLPAETFFWKQAQAWVPRDRPSDFNQAVMELGATVCLPLRPECRACPVRSLCTACRQGTQYGIPASRRRRNQEVVELVMLVMKSGGATLLTKQVAGGYIPGRWGLPTRTLPTGDRSIDLAGDLSRSLLGNRAELRPCPPVRHAITHRRIIAQIFKADLETQQPGPGAGGSFMWVDDAHLHRFIISSVFRKAIHSARAAK